MLTKQFRGFLLLLLTLGSIPSSHALDLKGTCWDRAGARYNINPKLLYAVALQESRKLRKESQNKGRVYTPWPWAFYTPDGSYFAKSKMDASLYLERQLEKHSKKTIDIGVMQINAHWNADGIPYENLLDLETNVMRGAKVLRAALDSSPEDMELGVGRYHHWKNPDVSRSYGRKVLVIFYNLMKL